ncbi:hypothetical protein ABBQ32_010696 [Trebouxia sp. C0010 RCD-2024]
MPALPTPDKKLLQLRKRFYGEDLDEYFDGLWQVELRVERSKRSGSENQRREAYFHHPTYGKARSLPDAVRAVKGWHSSSTSVVNASLAPTVATVKQDNAKLDNQSASFDWPAAKAFLKAVAYILCAVFVLFSSLVIYNLVTMQ